MPAKSTVFDVKNNVKQYEITNSQKSLVVKVLDYGGVVTNILFADKNNKTLDLVLGYDSFDGYLRADNPYFGALVGRYANRIAGGQFTLNDVKYDLDLNDGDGQHNTLHGGLQGFDKKKWTLKTSTDSSVTLELVSEDGDQEFPGAVKVDVTYTVTNDNELKLEYSAALLPDSLKDTVINLTNHSYFNLNGCSTSAGIQILNHRLRMNSDHFLEVDKYLIPTGNVVSTKSVPIMDFSGQTLQTLSDKIPKLIDGYDHCYVIDTNTDALSVGGGQTLKESVVVNSPLTGITLTFSTTEPAVQFYTANYLTDAFTTKSSQSAQPLKLSKYSAICLEGQRYVDAINHNNWRKQVILSPGQTYQQKTVYKFSNK